jgi:hypothetical protein
MSTLALYGSIVALVGAVVLLVLAFLSFRHARGAREGEPEA